MWTWVVWLCLSALVYRHGHPIHPPSILWNNIVLTIDCKRFWPVNLVPATRPRPLYPSALSCQATPSGRWEGFIVTRVINRACALRVVEFGAEERKTLEGLTQKTNYKWAPSPSVYLTKPCFWCITNISTHQKSKVREKNKTCLSIWTNRQGIIYFLITAKLFKSVILRWCQ